MALLSKSRRSTRTLLPCLAQSTSLTSPPSSHSSFSLFSTRPHPLFLLYEPSMHKAPRCDSIAVRWGRGVGLRTCWRSLSSSSSSSSYPSSSSIIGSSSSSPPSLSEPAPSSSSFFFPSSSILSPSPTSSSSESTTTSFFFPSSSSSSSSSSESASSSSFFPSSHSSSAPSPSSSSSSRSSSSSSSTFSSSSAAEDMEELIRSDEERLKSSQRSIGVAFTDKQLDQEIHKVENNIQHATEENISYLISHCDKRVSSAEHLFDLAVKRNTSAVGVPIYNAMIKIYVRNKHVDKALHLLESIPDPPHTTYNQLIDGLGMIGEINTMFDVVDKMLKRNIVPDTFICNQMIEACSDFQEFGKVDQVFDMMREHNIRADAETFVLLAPLYSGDKMCELVVMMQDRKRVVASDTYSLFVSGFEKALQEDALSGEKNSQGK